MTKKRRFRAGIDYAVCATSKAPSPMTSRRKRRRFSKSEAPPPLPFRTMTDLPQEVLHQILSPFIEPSNLYDNAATLLSISCICRSLRRQTSDFASSVLWSDHKISNPVGDPISHLTR